MSLLNPAGGLRYHWRAFRYGPTLWASHAKAVESWLNQWQPAPSGALIVVSPSAGYSLPSRWLQGFSELVVIEPDPVARSLFTRKLRNDQAIRWISTLEASLAEELPPAPVLFANVLGQLSLLGKKNEPQLRAAVERLTEGRAWASYHDLWSGRIPPRSRGPLDFAQTSAPAELLERFFGQAGGELNDHGALDWLSQAQRVRAGVNPRRYWVWELTPGHYHLIEAVSV